MAIKQHPFWERPFSWRERASAFLSCEVQAFRVSGQTGASLDVGATLTGGSDENIGLMSGFPRVR